MAFEISDNYFCNSPLPTVLSDALPSRLLLSFRASVADTEVPLGHAGALEMDHSASLGRSKLAARDHLGFAAAFNITAPDDVSDFEPARPSWDARIGRSSSFSTAGTLEIDHSGPLGLARALDLAAPDRFDFAGAC